MELSNVQAFPLDNRDFLRRQAIQRRDQPVNLRFEGVGVGGGVALFDGHGLAGDNIRFDA